MKTKQTSLFFSIGNVYFIALVIAPYISLIKLLALINAHSTNF